MERVMADAVISADDVAPPAFVEWNFVITRD
jgi:hypothetical protein